MRMFFVIEDQLASLVNSGNQMHAQDSVSAIIKDVDAPSSNGG